MPKIDLTVVSKVIGSKYPLQFQAPTAQRIRQRIGDAGGIKDFGVNLTRLPPGNWSSQRHWHSEEDEFVFIIEGEIFLIENDSEVVLKAGDCAAFPKNSPNGHHLLNRSEETAVYLEIGSRTPTDVISYSDIDMTSPSTTGEFLHKDGRPYE